MTVSSHNRSEGDEDHFCPSYRKADVGFIHGIFTLFIKPVPKEDLIRYCNGRILGQ